jgi:hypothetical protein
MQLASATGSRLKDPMGRVLVERLSSLMVEPVHCGGDRLIADAPEVGAPQEILPEQSVDVLVRAALQRGVRGRE